MKKMKKDELQATYDAMMNTEEPTDEQMELDGLNKQKKRLRKDLHQLMLKKMLTLLYKVKTFQKSSNQKQQFLGARSQV